MSQVRHATLEELLALRDGEGGAWAKEHVAGCQSCAGELYRLEQVRARLRSLPSFVPPRDRWVVIAGKARRERRRRLLNGGIGLAAAAVLAALSLVALRPAAQPDAAVERAALESAMARSQALEQALRALEPERRALSGEAAGVVVDLEDQLAALDAALNDPGAWRSQPGHLVELWRRRAGILSALVDVHETRAAVAGL